MTPTEFVNKLEKLKPSIEKLNRQNGLSIKEATEFQQYYIALKRRNPLKISITEGFYSDLVNCYDLSNIEIGPINFPEKPIELSSNEIIIAHEESHPIVLNKLSAEVMLLDMADTSFVMAHCAKDVARFFQALCIVGEFLEELSQNESLWDDPNNAKPAIAQCTLIAGGKRYRNFYEGLISI